ncbi:protein kinase domain-containing protein [Saccharopolyspora shandongensis]|uniref:protein kinase domain-containing protein n=1 Tax=Saccharopolyspora shandongensis TaxID=418495 RepID=UPI0033C4A5CD
MKKGDVIGDYHITSKPTNTDAGKCLWAFAEKDGQEFFIKEFLDPKRPRENFMGSPEAKRAIVAQCEEFEERHWSVIELLDPEDLDAGNLVTAVDFFFEGSRYYKVTRRLHLADLADPHLLTPYQKSVLLGTLADSLRLLHRKGIVHGDLKPQNVLLHQPPGSDLFTAKLIDFDDAYMSGAPPERTVIGGDALYGAPEWIRYVQADPEIGPEQLVTAVDMFAFGLMAHTYLTGALPGYDKRHGSPAEAVNAGDALEFDDRLSPALLHTLRALLRADPGSRPHIADVQDLLEQQEQLALRTNPPAPEDDYRVKVGRLQINFGGGKEPPSPSSGTQSRVRINLDGRNPEGRDEQRR